MHKNKNMRFKLLLLLGIVVAACQEKKPVDRMTEEQLRAYADELAHQFIITDGHVDLPYRLKVKNFRLEREYMGIPVSTKDGDFDFERAKMGGLDAPFMSIYIPSSYQQHPDKGKGLADSLINMINAIANEIPDKFVRANSPAEVESAFADGKIALPLGMENGAPIGDDLANVQYFFDRGIRYITLTHGKDNQICDSSYDTARTWNGLSPFGKEVVAEMNKVGIMVDISHVSDSAFYQAMRLSKVPCIASHSSCRAFTPGFLRNMSDDMIKVLGQNGGVIQINFGSAFLDSAVRTGNEQNRKKLQVLLDEKKLTMSDSLAKPVIAQFRKDNPSLYADVEIVANHIDRVVKLAGIDHVGLGSDFDGVGDSLPTGLKDVSQYPNLIFALLKRGYTESDIEKLCYKNVWRVWRAAEAYSKSVQ